MTAWRRWSASVVCREHRPTLTWDMLHTYENVAAINRDNLQMPARLQRIGSIASSSERRDSPTVDISQEKKPAAALITQKWRLRSTQYLCVPVRSSFLHISTKLETTSDGEWLNEPQCICIMEYCSVAERNGLLSTHWRNLQRFRCNSYSILER